MGTKTVKTDSDKTTPANNNVTEAAKVEAVAAAPESGASDPGTAEHPNPARAASDAAEAAAAEAAKAPAKNGKIDTKAPAKVTAASKNESDPFTKLAKDYAKRYPTNPVFHITSDKQVFLDKNKGLAEAHQRTLKGGAVTSITVKND